MGRHYSEYVKGQAKGLLIGGKSSKQISIILNVPLSTIKNWKKKLNSKQDLLKKVVKRKRLLISNTTARRMKLWLLCGKCSTIKELQLIWNRSEENKYKYSTILRALKRIGMIPMKKVKKPSLTAEHKKKRLIFARKLLKQKFNWSNVLFSDETKINLNGSDGTKVAWVRKEAKNHNIINNKRIISTKKFGGGSIMVWGCFGIKDIGFVCNLEGNINSSDYIDVLDQFMLPSVEYCVEDKSNYIFQQDNASIHTSNMTKNWFEKNSITLMEFPPCSPDLNPIENLWSIVKRRIYKKGPYNNKKSLIKAFNEEWSNITPDICRNLVESMTRRLKKVIQAKGGPIDY